MAKKETTTTKVVKTAVPASGTSSTKSSKKSTPVKVDLKKDLPSKVSLFKTIEVDTTKKMSLSDLGKSLVKLWDSTQRPSHFGLYVSALKKLDLIDVDYQSLAKIIKTLFTVKKVETKITHKTIAHYGSMISTGKVNIYESFNTGSGAGSTRESRTITDSQIDDMFKGLM